MKKIIDNRVNKTVKSEMKNKKNSQNVKSILNTPNRSSPTVTERKVRNAFEVLLDAKGDTPIKTPRR